MQRRTKWIAGGALALAVIGGSTGFAVAAAVRGDDQPITGGALGRATAAALEHTGGGTVIETEVGDGGAAYSVEVRLPGGGQVEVELNENFRVIGQEADDDGSADSDGSDEG